MTRIGAVVNDIRKKVAQSAPELSKRCRTLIKCWQKLAEPRPTSSGSSSTNGTPSHASPAIRKGLTPGTPARCPRVISGGNSRLTPARNSRLASLGSSVLTPSGSSGSQSTITSPTVPNGHTIASYQNSGHEMPMNTAESRTIRKSHTISADLAIKAVENSLLSGGEIIHNGKRKDENTATSDIGVTNGLCAKRPHYSSASVSPSTPHQSLLAAQRADVKSTSELVAQLTENLPGYLAINIPQNQVPIRNEHNNNEGQASDANQTVKTPILFTLQPENSKKKEKRGRFKKEKGKEKEGRIKDHSVANEKTIGAGIGNADSVLRCNISNNDPSTSKVVVPTRNGKYDWYAMLPSLETLRNREHFRSRPSSDQRKSYIMNVKGREVLALPYIDVGLPDFLEYQYPKPERFYAKENFIYGAPRPN
ncbi:unnamed protein product [Onchocerca flexuosa]|uniref:TFIIS N-terminal domain-containing protein n=1 Tax=Onchocerca flexuosa TaxID=387005 RepID=A0A183I409_9BILA|nr:unnamed protein product [Onchocerca flexuosa]